MRKYEAMATEAARKFCTRSCVTGHDCGLEHRKLLPLLDSTSSCPLEKYHCREKGREEPEKRLTFEEMMKAQPKNSDFFYLCADCLNGIIEENKKANLKFVRQTGTSAWTARFRTHGKRCRKLRRQQITVD